MRKFSRDWQAGYVDPHGFVRNGHLELLDPAGMVIAIDLREVKRVCFVREFQSGDNPERLVRRNFSSRPRTPGLWLRMRLHDGEEMEGLASNDVSLLEPEGIQFVPPDLRSNTQRIFVPREAIDSMEIVAVIHASSRRMSAGTGESVPGQEGLFTP